MLNAVRIWILLSTLLVAAGWVLSAFHQLNGTGYGVVLALAAGAFLVWTRKTRWRPRKNFAQLVKKLKNRFKRPAPLIFLILAALSFVSGCLYEPYNADTYSYRIPRVLHWLGQEQWHWIRTLDMRMNVAATGYEWMMTPVMLFTRANHFLFLINWFSYLMLPGLIFCVLRFTGVRGRVAWWWAWLLACGWCYVMQSASGVNDSFATVYALAAVALAEKARETGSANDLRLSVLAAALVTGVKQTDIPLVLLWAMAAWPLWRMALTRPLAASITVLCGLLVSGLPIIMADYQHTGDWSE